jgi:hypothetical protein
MDLAPDYNKIFANGLLVITGVARSGTTLLGKIIGSLSNTHFIFEPPTFRLIPPLILEGYLKEKQGDELLKAILFEELYLQIIHGRYINFNEKDDSYIGYYKDPEKIKQRWKKYKRRKDVIEDLEKNNYLFVLKIPNMQPNLNTIKKLFHNMKLIHCIRDGNDIISSSIRRDFYTQDYLNKRNIDWSNEIDSLKIPWFINKKDIQFFSKWNQYTRAAHIWRVLTETGLKFKDENKNNVFQFKFEDFIKNPETFIDRIERFTGKKRTDITMQHLDSIKTYKQLEYPDNIPNIESPEREKYIEFRKKLKYL